MCKHTFLSILLDLNFLKNQEESDTNGEEFLKKFSVLLSQMKILKRIEEKLCIVHDLCRFF